MALTKKTPQEIASELVKMDPAKTRFTSEEALQEGADRMALRYGNATKEDIREQRAERAQIAAQREADRAAALSADADETGTTRPAAAKKATAKKAESVPPPTADPDGAAGTDSPASTEA